MNRVGKFGDLSPWLFSEPIGLDLIFIEALFPAEGLIPKGFISVGFNEASNSDPEWVISCTRSLDLFLRPSLLAQHYTHFV